LSSTARPTTGRRALSGPPGLLSAFLIAVTAFLIAAPVASAETRTLKLHFVHTREQAEITYKRNGRYLPDGLKKINHILRDWRRNEPTRMDPQLLDLVWEVYRSVGAREHIHVVSAYRSPATNSMLRKRSNGVADKSQHMLGKAMDFYIPGVSLARLRAAALRAQGGGVGYYPTSGSPFVHLDVGNVRHWPRMNRSQLLAVFPDGKTLHVPTDGKPLPGYDQALASFKSRKRTGAVAVASAGSSSGGFLSRLFGGGADDEEDSVQMALDASGSTGGGVAVRRSQAAAPQPRAEVRAARGEQALPGVTPSAPVGRAEPAAPEPVQETPETIIAALPSRAVPLPLAAPRPQADVGPAAVVAAAVPAEPTPADAGLAMAANVPMPSWRPDYQPAGQAVAALVEDSAAGEGPAMPATALAPTPRPNNGTAAIAQALGQGVPAPFGRPATDASPEERQVLMAGLARSITIADDASPQSGEAGLAGKSSRASQRSTLMAGLGGSVDPYKAIASGVRTTSKSAKPVRGDAKPDRQPVVLPGEPSAARWAFQKDFDQIVATGTVPPSFAYNLVRTAPQTVYTAGFQAEAPSGDPKRFTGKAVTFLSVAKFKVN
jgi:uncharacterized protein YcbK (DUF882 family)